MIDEAILTAIHARLAAALATPSMHYRPLVVDGTVLGLLDDARAARLVPFRAIFRVAKESVALAETLRDCDWRSAALADVTQALRDQGEFPAWRDELYAVAPTFGPPAAFFIERGAARWFGVRTFAAHVNGVVGQGETSELWFARRSP